MHGLFGDEIVNRTSMEPILAHVAHIRHISTELECRRLLVQVFRFSKPDAIKTAPSVCAFLRQGIEFFFAARQAPWAVRPVLQYYAFSNLAVALIHCYRPPQYQAYKHHGVRDRTSGLSLLRLNSNVLEVSRGAIPLFNSIYSDLNLVGMKFTIRDLVIANPLLTSELIHAFGLRAPMFRCAESLALDQRDGGTSRWISRFTFESHGAAARIKGFRGRVEVSLPRLKADYKLINKSPTSVVYDSKKSWPEPQRSEALEFHRSNCVRFANWAGRIRADYSQLFKVDVPWIWYLGAGGPALPTLTACMLMSFFMSSIYRYRPNLVERLSDSSLNIVTDVFVQEVEALVIPAIRNMFYQQNVSISRVSAY